jgi:hypothetical protein
MMHNRRPRIRHSITDKKGKRLDAADLLQWKLSAKHKMLEIHPLNPDSRVNCKANFDIIRNECGIAKGERKWLFLTNDGKPTYELLKLKEEDPAGYKFLEPTSMSI